jgi:hypothetical protein
MPSISVIGAIIIGVISFLIVIGIYAIWKRPSEKSVSHPPGVSIAAGDPMMLTYRDVILRGSYVSGGVRGTYTKITFVPLDSTKIGSTRIVTEFGKSRTGPWSSGLNGIAELKFNSSLDRGSTSTVSGPYKGDDGAMMNYRITALDKDGSTIRFGLETQVGSMYAKI